MNASRIDRPFDADGRTDPFGEAFRHLGDGSAPASLARSARASLARASWRLAVVAAEAGKRLLDVVVSASALIALAPLFAVVALIIKLQDGGPVLFWQTRVGRWGRTFSCPKFRSMVVDADRLKDQLLASNDHGASVTFKMKRDPRITPIGRLIRKLSIDELPQLWCVFRGEMSLVGPRPPVPREVALYSLRDRLRLEAKPGLTCLWQVSGRGDLPFDRQVEARRRLHLSEEPEARPRPPGEDRSGRLDRPGAY